MKSIPEIRRDNHAASANARLRKAIEQAPCPWTACCLEHKVAARKGGDEWVACWKAKALGLTPGQDARP